MPPPMWVPRGQPLLGRAELPLGRALAVEEHPLLVRHTRAALAVEQPLALVAEQPLALIAEQPLALIAEQPLAHVVAEQPLAIRRAVAALVVAALVEEEHPLLTRPPVAVMEEEHKLLTRPAVAVMVEEHPLTRPVVAVMVEEHPPLTQAVVGTPRQLAAARRSDRAARSQSPIARHGPAGAPA